MDSTLDQFELKPPSDLNAEMSVLGSMMLDAAATVEVRAKIGRDAFYSADHQVIFDGLARLSDAGKPIDGVILKDELIRAGVFDEIGGIETLGEIISSVPSAAHAGHYAEIVRRLHLRREAIAIANRIQREAYRGAADGDEGGMIERAMTALAKLSSRSADTAQTLGAVLAGVRQLMIDGGLPTVTTGFRDLDAITGGIGMGEMWLVGGRPSMGKSIYLKQTALRIARSGVPAAIISLEENPAKIARNLLSSETRIDNHRIRKPKHLHARELDVIDAGMVALRDVPLHLCGGVRRLSDIRAQASLLVARHGVKFIAVDYLQRVQTPGRDKYERAGNASEGLSDLFKDTGAAGLVAVQLNRNVEGRDDKRPTMADLRDSGQIEQDADGLLLLHREDYYHTADKTYEPTGIVEVFIAKMRDGERGDVVNLRSDLSHQTFNDLELDHDCPV